MIDRLFGFYPDLAYAEALHAGALPSNIKVIEFFFLAGKWLHVPARSSIISPPTIPMPPRYLLASGLNVITQLVAKRVVDGETRYSLSCNTDTTLDLLRARAEGRASFKLIGQVNSELPFMPGAGDLGAEEFSAVLDSPGPIFRCLPRHRSRSPTPNTPSACMQRAWCAMAAACRSALARPATRWRRA